MYWGQMLHLLNLTCSSYDSSIHEKQAVDKLMKQLGFFIDRAVANFGGSPPLFGRCRHLIALPLIGTGAGGLTSGTGAVIRSMLELLILKSEAFQVDIALVLYEEDVYVAAVRERFRLMPFYYKLFMHESLLKGATLSTFEALPLLISLDIELFVNQQLPH